MEVTEKNECPIEAHEFRFKTIEDDVGELKGNVSELTNKVTSMDKENAIKNNTFATAIESLSKLSELPQTLNSLEKTMLSIQFKNDSTEKDVCGIKTKLDTIDEEGKFNIRVWIRDNWISCLLAIGGLVAIVANFPK